MMSAYEPAALARVPECDTHIVDFLVFMRARTRVRQCLHDCLRVCLRVCMCLHGGD